MKKIHSMTGRILSGLLLLAAAWAPGARAQDQNLGEMLFTAGTVATDSSGNEWAWIQIMASDALLLQDRTFDIYRRDGDLSSTAPFTLQGSARPTEDPRAVSLFLSRGQALGENLALLERAVDSLYAGAVPTNSLTLAEKVAALVAGSRNDPERFRNIVILARAHPSVAMAVGHAFACRIPSSGYFTFEVRDHASGDVVGRVVLQAGHPVVLPAPGPLYQVPETSPKGHLNIRLRWDIPAALRRLSLLQFGYNLYRVDKAAALAWWGPSAKPGSTADLLSRVGSDPRARKVNRMPILIDASTASSSTWYAVDDNDAFSGGTPFTDGAEYYYYLTALDLLGRDGDLSDPLLASPCDRMAPSVPHGVRVRCISAYTNGAREEWLEISWDHDTNDTDTARYYVYRFSSLAEMQSNAAFAVSNRISGPIVPPPGATRISYDDRSLTTNDWGRTWWYTVRAEDDASCSPNLSGNSPPAYGVLRDWVGPPPATGVTARVCVRTYSAAFVREEFADGAVELRCRRLDPAVAWVEFSYAEGQYASKPPSNAVVIGRFWFAPKSDEIVRRVVISGFDKERYYTFFCRVGGNNGDASEYASRPILEDALLRFEGNSALECNLPPSDTRPHDWGSGTNVHYPVIHIPPVESAVSYRLYRRVDHGPRVLIAQGEMDDIIGALITDYTGGAAHGAVICYYYQLFDENGNSGPLVKICCFRTKPRVELPAPILDDPEPAGDAAHPAMSVSWFCPPPGVERFEMAVAIDASNSVASSFAGWTVMPGVANQITVVEDGVTNTYPFIFFRSKRIGTSFGSPDSPRFEETAVISSVRRYTLMVRAVGPNGAVGPWSNVRHFRWNIPPSDPSGPDVPWPARPLPSVQTDLFHTNLSAEFLDVSAMQGIGESLVGIRIGEIPPAYVERSDKDGTWLQDYFDPQIFLYTNQAAQAATAFPCVLYRYQVTNEFFHSVSGDIAQVSPLMEEIAWGKNPAGNTVIRDPFIAVARHIDSAEPWGVYLIDTRPVVRHASYRYLLVRFDEETREIDRVIPVGDTVTIP